MEDAAQQVIDGLAAACERLEDENAELHRRVRELGGLGYSDLDNCDRLRDRAPKEEPPYLGGELSHFTN